MLLAKKNRQETIAKDAKLFTPSLADATTASEVRRRPDMKTKASMSVAAFPTSGNTYCA
jgi:hypothetical protein